MRWLQGLPRSVRLVHGRHCVLRAFSDAAARGLELMGQGKFAEAVPHLQSAVEDGGSDDFEQSAEVFFALGVLAQRTLERNEGEHSCAGGAANREEVLRQIQAQRREAMRRKKARATGDGTPVTITHHSSSSARFTLLEEDALAAGFFELAADRGHTGAMVGLGNLCLQRAEADYGEGTPDEAWRLQTRRAIEQAIEWYHQAADAEPPHADALYNLGQVFFTGRGGSKIRREEAVALFQRSARAGDSSAEFFLFQLYRVGDAEANIAEDPQECLRHLDNAVRAKHPQATYYKALLHRTGDPDLEIEASHEEFLRFLGIAVELGDPEATFCLGDMLYHGSDGLDQDLEAAHRHLKAAAQAGHADAMCSLGSLYYQGQGCEKDLQAAFHWYQQAAETGKEDGSPHREAWLNVANMHARGDFVPKNMEVAKQILRFLESTQGGGHPQEQGQGTIEK
uniref:Uncharacterized protein n=1 Tax=Rhizochromulina marina TaxID=1034831 RepID=A0A7S2RU95_9STRA|mmetsp:Transcript_2107/g.6070  ORF Transcript_2107/g.6070 Transcript_2107/m.6070 type:complete len:453 (+) Transcript_2107:84-1442(+)